jgi:hypothetical protein
MRSDNRGRDLRAAALCAALALNFAACGVSDKLLKADSGRLISADALDDPAQIALVVNGALGDFDCAWGAHVFLSGVISDEIADAQLGAAQWPHDRRDFVPGDNYGTAGCGVQGVGVYTPTATARYSLDNALNKLQSDAFASVAQRDALTAVSAAMGGFMYVVLAEDFCTAAVDLGPELQSADLLKVAETRFTTAIDAATKANATAVLNLSRVGRARVRLDLGNKAGAITDAQLVPQGFVYNSTASDINTRRMNRIAANMISSRLYVIEPVSQSLTTEGVKDPRAAVIVTTARASDGTVSSVPAKYPSANTPIPIARYEEAQLILAEAQGGQAAVDIINKLHTAAGLPAYSGTAATVASWIPEERRRELFLEGHRLYDIIRFKLPLLPAPGTANAHGGFYGSQVCMPLPDVERFNNPNIRR